MRAFQKMLRSLPPSPFLTSAFSAPASARTSAVLLLLLSPGVGRALRGRRPLQADANAAAGRRRRCSAAAAVAGLARLRRRRGPHGPDGRARQLGASGRGARDDGAREWRRGDACRRTRGERLEHLVVVVVVVFARLVFSLLWNMLSDETFHFLLDSGVVDQKRKAKAKGTALFFALPFFPELAHCCCSSSLR